MWAEEGGVLYLNRGLRQKTTSSSGHIPERPVEQNAAQLITLRVDFVSRPDNKCEIAAEVGELLAEAGLYQKGLKASMVLVPDREARVVTLLTLWDADRFNASRERLTTGTLRIVAHVAGGRLGALTSVAHSLLSKES